jgi:hypothetical protein
MKRRESSRPAQVVEQIRADDGPDTRALLERMKEAGFHFWSKVEEGTKLKPGKMRKASVRVPVYYLLMAEELARWQGITAEQFMSAILTEGLYEAFLEVNVQKNHAARERRGRESGPPLGHGMTSPDER